MMQGVDVLVVTTLNGPWSVDFLAKEFFQCLVGEKLLDQCKAVVVRISAWKTDNTWLHRSSIKPLTADAILSESGLNAAKTIQDKLCKQKMVGGRCVVMGSIEEIGQRCVLIDKDIAILFVVK